MSAARSTTRTISEPPRTSANPVEPRRTPSNLFEPLRTSDPHKHSRYGLSRRTADGRRIQRELPPVLFFAGRGDFAIGFVVDDRPGSVLFEREVDNAFEQRPVLERQRDGRFPPAGAALVRTPC